MASLRFRSFDGPRTGGQNIHVILHRFVIRSSMMGIGLGFVIAGFVLVVAALLVTMGSTTKRHLSDRHLVRAVDVSIVAAAVLVVHGMIEVSGLADTWYALTGVVFTVTIGAVIHQMNGFATSRGEVE